MSWGITKIDGKVTFKNLKTGEICSQRFENAEYRGFEDAEYRVRDDWYWVKTKNGDTFFNPNTKELCSQRFEDAGYVYEGWATVKTGDGECTFFNPNTKELCSQRFKNAWHVSEGWAVVETEDGWTFFNPNTKELCSQRFEDAGYVYEGWARVKTDDGWTFFNPELDTTFQTKFSSKDNISIETCLREHPEDFALLPTVQFRNQENFESYLNAAAKGIKALCPTKGTTEEVEKFANEMKTLIANKIKKEKAKIAEQDAADEIKNLGRLLNDDEAGV